MDNFSERIRGARKTRGWSQTDLAAAAKLSLPTVQRAEGTGRPPSAQVLDHLMRVLMDDAAHPMDASDAPALVHIPLVAPRLSAGAGEVVQSEETVKHLAFRRDWMTRKGSAKDMVLFRVTGDSMRPTVMSGDIVMVDTSRTEIAEDQVHAVSWFGEIAVKRLRRDESGRVEVVSDNPGYPMRLAEGDGFRVIGRVVWLGRELA